MAQFRILFADDDHMIRSVVEAILKARGYLIFTAEDGVEAIAVLDSLGGPVDLLITDIKMPRMDGVALARAVAEIYPAMPVLFISAWSEPLDDLQWRKPRYAFLRKPFLLKALVNSVEQLLVRSASQSAS